MKVTYFTFSSSLMILQI